jgi:solute carrier family 35 protein E1
LAINSQLAKSHITTHQKTITTMKLSITLSLALAGACSAFALAPGATTRTNAGSVVGAFDKPAAAFVQQQRHHTSTALSAATASASSSDAIQTRGGGSLGGFDVPLMIYFLLWYVGNYYYNISNKLALKAAGGATGFPMTISALQLGIGSLYGIFLWLAPDARERPKVTMDDIIKMLPVAFCYAGAHSASVFSFSQGSVSFGQIVKASEPAFAAVLSQFVYGKPVSKAKWLCLPIVIGGVILASVNELDFAVSALVSACIANMFAAVRGNENKKLMETEGLKDRIGSVGNQFCITSILGFLLSIPFVLVKEGGRFGEFVEAFKTVPALRSNMIASALWFYGYNELSTMTLKKTVSYILFLFVCVHVMCT